MATNAQLCTRAREWASLRADGELSELESALLDAHLGRCEDCAAFARRLDDIVAAVRSAPLQAAPPVAIAARRGRPRALPAFLAAALVVVASVVGSLIGFGSRPAPLAPTAQTAQTTVVSEIAAADTPDQLRRLRRTVLLDMRKIPRNLSGETA